MNEQNPSASQSQMTTSQATQATPHTWLDDVVFNDAGLVPAIAQDHATGDILMVAWMNREALALSAQKNQAVYFSRSRNKLWHKGETSGHFQSIKELRLDCDGDVIILMVEQHGGIACHTGRRSCFYRKLINGQWQVVAQVLKDPSDIYGAVAKPNADAGVAHESPKADTADTLSALAAVLQARKSASADSSYVASLYAKGLNKILEKIGEEAVEVILAAKELGSSQVTSAAPINEALAKDVVYEVADLWFHVLIMLSHFDLEPNAILTELARRFGMSGIEEKAARQAK